MDFQQVLDNQKSIIEEYSLGNKPIKAILNGLQKKSEEIFTPFEDMDVKTIQEVCNRQKTRRGFSTTKTIIGGFYSYLNCKDIAEQISLFEYQNRINYFVSFEHLREVFNSEIRRLLNEQIILDENRLGNLRLCIYLLALGLSTDEISQLKRSDYDNVNATIQSGEKLIQLPDGANREIDTFCKTDEYKYLRRDKIMYCRFVESDKLIKPTRINSPENKSSIYQIFRSDMGFLNFDMTDVHKSRAMWELLKANNIDISSPDFISMIKFIDYDKIINNIGYDNNIIKSEMEVFIATVKDYYEQ